MDTSSSPALRDYYAHERETIKTEPAVRAELRGLGVSDVEAVYDGIGDSGQIEQLCYQDAADPTRAIEVGKEMNERVESLFYALLELRHGGWENNDGAYGAFRWNLVAGTIEHEHNHRYTEVETSVHEGFEIDAGKYP